MLTRDETIKSLFDTSGFGLEIGPSYNPLLPKAAGFNVETVDHASATELREKYSFMLDAGERIEEVDYVSDGRPLSEIIKSKNKYDFVFASHVIEHVTDITAFLNDCGSLLKAQGKIILAVPDKRYCFDFFRPLSTIGQAIEAHLSRPTRHSTGILFDHLSYFVQRNDQSVWVDNETSKAKLQHQLSEAFSLALIASQSSDYYDAHAWRFTPTSFHYIVRCLNALRLVNLGIEKITRFEGPVFKHEFYVVMSAGFYTHEFSTSEREDFLSQIEIDLGMTSLDQAKEERDQRDEHLAQVEAERNRAEADIAAIRNSRSWKITEPMRRIARTFSRW